jgi:hypothetical protein
VLWARVCQEELSHRLHNLCTGSEEEAPVVMPPPAEACDPASRRSDIWLGARSTGEDSFPLTEVPHLDPAMSLFRAELTSRSCDSPQFTQTHCLTARCLRPLGPVRARQLEHARVVFFSLTT